MKTELYKVMEMFEGYAQAVSVMLTWDEARVKQNNLTKTFNECDYYIVAHSDSEIEAFENKQNRVYNNNAVDGWEDIYPI